MTARLRRALDMFLTGLLGGKCDLCGQRTYLADRPLHVETNHAGDA